MLTFAEAQARAKGRLATDSKVWFIGYSYGTVLGSTFAALFPDRVGRLVLDAVVDPRDYYENLWMSNLAQADEVAESFFITCYEAGPEKCAFYAPSPLAIATRYTKIARKLEKAPLPVAYYNTLRMPELVMWSDLMEHFAMSV